MKEKKFQIQNVIYVIYIYNVNVNGVGYSLGDQSKSCVTLNGTTYANSTATFYAPTTLGDDGSVLTCSGNTPVWSPSAYFVADAPFFYQYDGAGYVFGAYFDSRPIGGSSKLLNSAAIYNTLTGYTTSSKNYKINLSADGYAYVSVPWTNTLTYLKTASSSTIYDSTAYTSATVIRSLAGLTYGATYCISCVQSASNGRIYVNTQNTNQYLVSTYTIAYAGYTTQLVGVQALSLFVAVPAGATWYLVGQYVTAITIQRVWISG